MIAAAKRPLRFPKLNSLPASHSTLGVDIGTQWTKIVWAKCGPLVRPELACLKLPTRSAADRDPAQANNWARRDFQKMAGQLKAALRNARAGRPQRLAATVSMAWCDVRSVGNDGAVGGGSPKGVEDRMAASSNEGEALCVATLPRRNEAENSFDTERMLTLPQRLALDICEALDEQRLELNVLDGGPWCMARALLQVAQPADLEVMLDWGHQAITLVACHNSEMVYCRKLECSGLAQVLAGMRRDFNLSEAECIRLLPRMQGQSFISAEARRAGDVVAGLLNEHATAVAKQFHIAMRYLEWRFPKHPLKHVWISGGGAHVSSNLEHLSTQFGIPFQPWTWTPAAGLPVLTADMALAAALVRWE
jgi:hypothetical protein